MARSSVSLLKLLKSPIRILAMMLFVVFGIELMVMLALSYLTPQSMHPLKRSLLDSGLLTLVCAPVLWWLIVGPLRRIAAQEMARSETIVANAGEGILTIDRSGVIISANRAAEKLFDKPVEAIIGVEIRALIPELSLENIVEGGDLRWKGYDRAESFFHCFSQSVNRPRNWNLFRLQ